MHRRSKPLRRNVTPDSAEERGVRDIGVRTYLNSEEKGCLEDFENMFGFTESAAVRALVLSGLEVWRKQIADAASNGSVGVALEALALAARKAG